MAIAAMQEQKITQWQHTRFITWISTLPHIDEANRQTLYEFMPLPGDPTKDEQEKIFQDFYRATNIKNTDKEGSGLGLSVVKQIVERHNGNIILKSPSRLSVNGHSGSCFTISLPYKIEEKI